MQTWSRWYKRLKMNKRTQQTSPRYDAHLMKRFKSKFFLSSLRCPKKCCLAVHNINRLIHQHLFYCVYTLMMWVWRLLLIQDLNSQSDEHNITLLSQLEEFSFRGQSKFWLVISKPSKCSTAALKQKNLSVITFYCGTILEKRSDTICVPLCDL